MAVSASRHLCPVPRGWGRGVDFRHTTVTDNKKLSTSGFLRCSSPNGPAPDLGTLRAMCHLLRSCWAETTLSNKTPHMKPFADLQKDTHFVMSFIKKHAILYERRTSSTQRKGIPLALELEP